MIKVMLLSLVVWFLAVAPINSILYGLIVNHSDIDYVARMTAYNSERLTDLENQVADLETLSCNVR